MSLNARDRKHKIQLQTYVAVEDEYGGEEMSWVKLCDEYAAISFGTGQERRDAAQESASAPATFGVLSNSKTKQLSTADRIAYPITDPDPDAWPTWDITSIAPSKQFNRGWDITAVVAAK